MRKWIVIGGLVLTVLVTALVVGGVALFMGILGMLDRSDAHVCGMAAVKRSAAAIELVGSPMEQTGFSGGSTSYENGTLQERISFDVKGPRGQASVLARGVRSPLTSHLRVQVGRDGSNATVYDGKFDCAELHAPKK